MTEGKQKEDVNDEEKVKKDVERRRYNEQRSKWTKSRKGYSKKNIYIYIRPLNFIHEFAPGALLAEGNVKVKGLLR